jgi:lysophospholipase L1-like esterase
MVSTSRRRVVGGGMSRIVGLALTIVYCAVIWLALDVVYSSFLRPRPRVDNPVFHHTLATSFQGVDVWGTQHYKLYTNNLGFRDIAARNVPLVSSTRRILLMGDSFTEGLGMAFEDSFAGMLYAAGQFRTPKIEFLNGGVSGYSPTLYYRKIKYFLDQGLRFDELVLFPDMSDVWEEATQYFCIDDDPKYRAHCKDRDIDLEKEAFLRSLFSVTNTIRVTIKSKLAEWRHGLPDPAPNLELFFPVDAWSVPDHLTRWPYLKDLYAPLGADGGIIRSLRRMQDIADLLKSFGIPLSVVVFPHPPEVAHNDQFNRQVQLYQDFCKLNCKHFINVFPPFLATAKSQPDWYPRYFILGDFHFSAQGNRLMFEELAKYLL